MYRGDPPDVLRSDQIPEGCFRELRSLYVKPLRYVIRKANRQIRETKETLNLVDYKGLLLLANDGNFAMPPDTLLRLVFQILNGLPCRHIVDCVIFSVNMLAKVPGSDIPSYVWLTGFLSGETPIHLEAIQDIGTKWKSHHEAIAGQTFSDLGSFKTQRFPI